MRGTGSEKGSETGQFATGRLATGQLATGLCAAALIAVSLPIAGGVGWLLWTAAAVEISAPASLSGVGPGLALGGLVFIGAIGVALTPDARLRTALWAAALAAAVLVFLLAPHGAGNIVKALSGGAAPEAGRTADGPGAAAAAATGFIVAVGHALLVTVTATLAGYVASRHAFRGRASLLIALFAVQAFPTMALIAPQFLVLRGLNMVDAPLGAILALGALELPFAILFMKTAFDRIPTELELSALADGASRLDAFRDAALPLAAPAIIAIALLSFIVGWGDYVVTQIVFVSQEHWTFSMYVHRLADANLGVDHGALAALAIAYATPPLICLALAQRVLTRAGGWRRLFE